MNCWEYLTLDSLLSSRLSSLHSLSEASLTSHVIERYPHLLHPLQIKSLQELQYLSQVICVSWLLHPVPGAPQSMVQGVLSSLTLPVDTLSIAVLVAVP